MQPVGRRQLAAKLNLPEREIRNTAAILKDLGYIDLDASGMSLSDKADEVLETSRAFSKAMSGLTEMETRLCELLPADRVLIAPGNADDDEQVLSDVGRICAQKLRSILMNGNTLAVTGGRTIAAVARNLQSQTPLNVMVVPARGGIGRSVELQANTLAEEIAGRLGVTERVVNGCVRRMRKNGVEVPNVRAARDAAKRREKAEAFRRMKDAEGLPVSEIARREGVSPQRIYQAMQIPDSGGTEAGG